MAIDPPVLSDVLLWVCLAFNYRLRQSRDRKGAARIRHIHACPERIKLALSEVEVSNGPRASCSDFTGTTGFTVGANSDVSCNPWLGMPIHSIF